MEERGQEPGQFARERYKRLNRIWLRRVWWMAVLAGLFVFGVAVGIGLLIGGDQTFWLGVGTGGAVTFVMCLLGEPPRRIENWKLGWEGERKTAKALRPLESKGWRVFHDVRAKWGNYDHIVVGPFGVYVLESKNLDGVLSVDSDNLNVTSREDPEWTRRTQHGLAPRLKGGAFELHKRLSTPIGGKVYVNAVVVLWGDFAQRQVAGSNIHWIAGEDVAAFIEQHVTAGRRVYDVDLLAQRVMDDKLVDRPTSVGPPATAVAARK